MASPTVDRRLGLVGNAALKAPVLVVATSNITLSGEQTIDGESALASNASGVPDRVLCTAQTDPKENVIWDVSTGAWTKAKDSDGSYDLMKGTTVFVTDGATYGATYWQITSDGPITPGTTSVTWTTVITAVTASVAAAAASAAAAATAETNAETAETNAETAETNAELAEANAEAAEVAAEAAQLAAEIARDTALTLGKLFPDTTAGLAAVAGNEYFLVPVSSTDYTELVLYQDVAGVATERGRWSISYFETSILGQHVYADKNGNVFAYYDQQGELRLKGHTRGVHQRLDDARAQAFFSAAVAIGGRKADDATEAALIGRDAELVDDTLGGTAWASEQFKVFEYDTTRQYRFPTLLQISPGNLLLFANELEAPTGTDDVHHARIIVSDVTFDFQSKSFTVSAPREVVNNRAFTSGASKAYAIGHTPLLVRTGTNKGRIYLAFGSNKDAPATISAEKPYLTYSDDNGVTWAADSAFAVATGGFDNFGYGTGMKGIQLKYGANRGRLLLSWYSNTQVNHTKCFSVYSNDGGANWLRGTPFGPAAPSTGITEPSFSEDVDGTVYAACRGDSTAINDVQLWKSVDGGVTFTLVDSSLVRNSNVQISTAQVSEASPSTSKMLIAWTNSISAREKLTVSVTYDSWTTLTNKQLDAGSAGYSAIEAVGEDYIMAAWEKNYYGGLVHDTVVLQAFNIKHITG